MLLAQPGSVQGMTMGGEWYIFIAVAAVIAAIVYALILAPLVIWREKAGREPARFTGNVRLEIAYTIIPLLIVAALFVDTYSREMRVDHVVARPAARIAVTAFRWSWRFEYGNGVSVSGTPAQEPTLYLPLGKTTEIELRTVDVNHSFWVPEFLFKRDAIPGMINRFDLTPTRLGSFTSRCAQFCGLDHALMTFLVKVVPESAYDRYIASKGKAVP